MNRVTFVIGATIGGLITSIAGISAIHLGTIGFVLPKAREIAHEIPGLTGRIILSVCHETIFGYHLNISQKPPPFLGTTVIMCNHPKLEDLPALTGVLAKWDLHPSFVSKVENLEGIIGFFVGKPIKLIGKGLFISQKGGKRAKKTLKLGAKEQIPKSILIFPDQHRPSTEAIKQDQDDFPEAGLKTLCVPRSGGVRAILSGLVLRHQPVRVLDVSWHNDGRKIDVHWEDVTTSLLNVTPYETSLLGEEIIREALMGLWKQKDGHS